jgi:hypothetical protein
MSEPEKAGDVCARLLKWAQENAEELARRSAEYDEQKRLRLERESSAQVEELERLRGLPPLERYPGIRPEQFEEGTYWGLPGTRKTGRAVAGLLSVSSKAGIFIASADFVEIERKIDLDRASPFEVQRRDLCFERKYLVFDDLGARRPTAFAVDKVHDLFDRRWRYRLPTLVTTNLTMQEIADQWGPALASRMADFGPVQGPPERFGGADWRIKHSLENSARARAAALAGRSPFLRIAPRHDDEETPGVSQGEVLADLEPGRPRNGGAA